MTWTQELRQSVTDISQLQRKLGLSAAELAQLQKLCAQFPMSVPQYYLDLINWNDPSDPIRKMCIPTFFEADSSGTFDTSGEVDNTVCVGVQHKYRESALILTTNRCAMYCRHCFRKRQVGLSDEEIAHHFFDVVSYIYEHKEVSNVILDGGDALMLPTKTLIRYLTAFTEMGHLDLIRITTRIPVVLPARISEDRDLHDALRLYGRKKQIYIITQFNHPNEVTEDAGKALRILLECSVAVKNQTVLLKGVNDDPVVLGTLLRKLTAHGVVPYYVFQCRPVVGVKSSFQVPISQGYDIVEGAKAMQNGQGKCLKYCMSHSRGKIEIAGKLEDGSMLFKFHQAKYDCDASRIFIRKLTEETWIPDDI